MQKLKKEKKKPVEEKKIEPKVEIKKEPKKDEASAIKTQEIEAASSVLEYLLPKEVETYDEGIIDKVSKQISEMKVANELEKDKMTGLRSIDTLDKLTREFLNFKNIKPEDEVKLYYDILTLYDSLGQKEQKETL